jgi:hypothetical protein
LIVIATASADTYITNKLIDALPAVSGNVGRAGTIDLFKLYDESTYVTGTIELSRALTRQEGVGTWPRVHRPHPPVHRLG